MGGTWGFLFLCAYFITFVAFCGVCVAWRLKGAVAFFVIKYET